MITDLSPYPAEYIDPQGGASYVGMATSEPGTQPYAGSDMEVAMLNPNLRGRLNEQVQE